MSHTVEVKMIADQEIEIAGKKVNIHDIQTIVVDGRGKIINAFATIKKSRWIAGDQNVWSKTRTKRENSHK